MEFILSFGLSARDGKITGIFGPAKTAAASAPSPKKASAL
jgi:hypothetical protein